MGKGLTIELYFEELLDILELGMKLKKSDRLDISIFNSSGILIANVNDDCKKVMETPDGSVWFYLKNQSKIVIDEKIKWEILVDDIDRPNYFSLLSENENILIKIHIL